MALKLATALEAPAKTQSWSRQRWRWIYCLLTLATFLVHGFHPFAEDGGLYAAGVEFSLNRALFPHSTRFVAKHLGFSLFAPTLTALVRLTHLSLEAVLLLVYLASIALTLVAARAILRRCNASEPAQLTGIALLAALWTLPVAATALFLMDPYVTARSLSTPLSLLAIAFALDPWPFSAPARSPRAWRSFALCAASLALAILFHPLMAGYALGLILLLRLLRARNSSAILFVAAFTLALAAVLQALAPLETPNAVAASLTRYYWFLSQWHWYERLGLLCPLLLFALFLRAWRNLREPGRLLCRAAIVLGILAVVVALLFAHESYRSHLVARLQPLRSFLPIYAVMVLLLGASLEEAAAHLAKRLHSALSQRLLAVLPAFLLLVTAVSMFAVQRAEFPASTHLELPWRTQSNPNPNPWAQAFFWCRAHTPPNALFALDAHYITLPGEDAQTFRAISERSALPDFSKDGGEAAIAPSLADTWAAGVAAQLNLNHETDAARLAHLQPYPVDWLVLLSSATTALPCPYNNGTVKVCRLVP